MSVSVIMGVLRFGSTWDGYKVFDHDKIKSRPPSAPEHADLFIPLLCGKPGPTADTEFIPSLLIRNRSLLLTNIVGTVLRVESVCPLDSPMGNWITGSTTEPLDTSHVPRCDNAWNATDSFGGKARYEFPKLIYYAIKYYEYLAEMGLQVTDDKRQIPEISTLLPPSSDGTVHTDRDMESASALFKDGIIPEIYKHERFSNRLQFTRIQIQLLV